MNDHLRTFILGIMAIQAQRSAAHEAGHATLALLFGFNLTSVSIDGGEGGIGVVKSLPPRTEIEIINLSLEGNNWDDVRQEYERIMLQLAAGAAGERLVFGNSFGEGSPQEEYSDWGLLLYLKDLWEEDSARPSLQIDRNIPFSSTVEKALGQLEDSKAKKIFQGIYEELIEKRTLTGGECQEIFRSVDFAR